jgi:hypothetical protein
VTIGRMTDCSFIRCTVVCRWNINIYCLQLMPLLTLGIGYQNLETSAYDLITTAREGILFSPDTQDRPFRRRSGQARKCSVSLSLLHEDQANSKGTCSIRRVAHSASAWSSVHSDISTCTCLFPGVSMSSCNLTPLFLI